MKSCLPVEGEAGISGPRLDISESSSSGESADEILSENKTDGDANINDNL